MNTHNHPQGTGGHHGEFQAKSPSHGHVPSRNPAGNNRRTFVYRQDPKMSAIERALDNIIPPENRADFHAKKMNKPAGKRPARGPRTFEKTFTRTESIPNPRKKKDVIPPLKPGDIRVIPVHGVEGIGGNMTMVEYKDQIVVIDAGIEFTDDETPGMDYIIPNTKYLEERKHMIKGLVITHGHLDHVGSIPFVIEALGNPPIYTREFGAMVIKKRQEEFPQVAELNIKIVEKDDGSIPISEDLKVRFFGLTHSIPDSAGVIIETPLGDIISTGDVRVDNHDGIATDAEYEQWAMFKNRNVLLMTMDSTGVPNPGWSISEDVVIETIDKLIKETNGRLFITAFASQVERIMQFIKSTQKYGKFIVVEGRSMRTNIGIVDHLKLMKLDNVVPIEDMHKYPPHKIVILATGGQAEQYSLLDRVARGTHKYLKLSQADTIIFSSSVVPGNEVAVQNLKDMLYRHDPKIITYQDSSVHTSGHGKRGELEWIHKQINYKFFMPIHGHHFMLKMHRDLAEGLGISRDRIVVPDNGSVIEIRNNGTEIVKLDVKAPSELTLVEGNRVGDIQEVVIRDRKLLAESGVMNVFAVIDEKSGKLKKSPDIFSRGFVYIRENQELFHKLRGLVKKVIEERTENPKFSVDELREELIEKIERFLMQKTGKKPIVMAAIVTF